jgi:RHH-type proline utilization regulon transcriptional repressor/proline dehydrogenase/delta 1-pyrroline-5-carboxylate dehydrogenase
LSSAFNSAGQRCSALRLLFVQEDIAPTVIDMLAGAILELQLGDPMRISTDVGPVIDGDAKTKLEAYVERLKSCANRIAVAPLGAETEHGSFFAPQAYEIDIGRIPEREVFGPVLHVIRWRAAELDSVVDAINATGYGLTLGVHSRIDETIARVTARAHVGNIYVNRNMIGAVVGVQPFGGEGLSGTGPKAGGPHYLLRFGVERTVSTNTAAVGGNAALLALDDE